MKQSLSPSFPRCPKLGISAFEKEVSDLYLPFSDEDDQLKAREASQPPKPFASFGSFRQRHGDVLACNHARTIEAPAKLESGARLASSSHSCGSSSHHNESIGGVVQPHSLPINCDRPASSLASKHGQCFKGKSFSTDLDREEAWERKKEQYLLEEETDDCGDSEEYDADEGFYDDLYENENEDDGDIHNHVDDDCKGIDEQNVEHTEGITDIGGCLDVARDGVKHSDAIHDDAVKKTCKRASVYRKKSMARPPIKPLLRTRTKSLTDEDMEELRGSIDLGFGFSYNERCNLTSTLPALELYYAINRNFVDAKSRSSPVSPLDGNVLVRTNSAGSTSSPSNDSWRISSPGDHPSQVKTRLRHWAQAVACSVKQGNWDD